MSKPRQLVITATRKGFGFAETKHGKKENVFVSFNARGVVGETKGGNPKLLKKKNAPRYLLKKGDVIVGVVADGNEKRRKVKAWAPLSVWNGGEHPIISKTKKPQKKVQKTDKKVEEPDFIGEIDLPFLDQYRNRDIMIRVRPPCGQGQIYCGPLGTLFSKKAKAHILARVNNPDNIFEAQIDGKWQQIWPPISKEKKATKSA